MEEQGIFVAWLLYTLVTASTNPVGSTGTLSQHSPFHLVEADPLIMLNLAGMVPNCGLLVARSARCGGWLGCPWGPSL